MISLLLYKVFDERMRCLFSGEVDECINADLELEALCDDYGTEEHAEYEWGDHDDLEYCW